MPKVSELIALGMPESLASRVAVKTVATGITAAGTTIADATDLTAEVNVIGTADASTGVQLWNAPVGAEVRVRNSGANTVSVYPHSSSGTINGGSAGSAQTIATTKNGLFIRETSTNWLYTLID